MKGRGNGADSWCTNQYLLRRGGGMGRIYGAYELINLTTKGSVTRVDVKCLCTNQFVLRRGGVMEWMVGVNVQINFYY